MNGTVLVAGASGLIGQALINRLLHEPSLPVAALVRRPLGLVAPQLQEVICDFAALGPCPVPTAQTAFCCLGTTLNTAGSREAFRRVDFDFILNFARAAQKAGVECFVLLSAAGASERSRVYYSRVKGETEAAVTAIGFKRLVIARPSLLLGDRERLGQPSRPVESFARRFLAPGVGLIPAAYRPIRAEVLAGALIALAKDAPAGTLIAENPRLLVAGA